MIRRSRYVSLVLLLLLMAEPSFAQRHRVRARLSTVPATGFYRIPVTPEITTYARPDLYDLRIVHDSTAEVPYINARDIKRKQAATFTPFQIISTQTSGKYTTLILGNTTGESLADITLSIANTAVERYTTLSGSADKNTWFVIDDSILFHRSQASDNNTYSQTIHFPQSNFRYYKLKIDNDRSDPLQVTAAGIFTAAERDIATVFTNAAPSFRQRDSSNHTSYIYVTQPARYLTDKITVAITGPKFYRREGVLYVLTPETDSTMKHDAIATFIFTSGQPAIINIPVQKSTQLLLAIENNDNPVLHIDSVSSTQETQYLVAWLEEGKQYDLLAGQPTAEAPRYDLTHFKDDIPGSLPVLAIGPLREQSPEVIVCPGEPAKNTWLWPTIIVAVIVLSLLTYRLMKDVKKENG